MINDSLLQSDIRAGAVTSDEVLDNSLYGVDVADDALTGADINESTLASTATATFAGPPGIPAVTSSMTKMTGKAVPRGSHAVIATANLTLASPFLDDSDTTTSCELRNQGSFIGGATDRHTIPRRGHRHRVAHHEWRAARCPAEGARSASGAGPTAAVSGDTARS